MNVVTASEARANLKSVMDRAVDDREPTVIARSRGRSVVVMALADWREMDTTEYLLASPANAQALREGIAAFEANEVIERDAA